MGSLLQAQWCPGLVALRYVGSWGVPGGARSKGDIGDRDSFPGSGRSPGGGHSNPLQYSCLENPTDRGSWWSMVHRVAKSQTQLKQLNTHTHTHMWDLRSPTRDGTHIPCIRRQVPKHWTAREVPNESFKVNISEIFVPFFYPA